MTNEKNTQAGKSKVFLKAGRDKPVLHRHPWVFSGAVDRMEGALACGGVVEVHGAGGEWLARGLLHPTADLRVRLFTWNPDEALDDAFWTRRICQALAWREKLLQIGVRVQNSGAAPVAEPTNAWRLIFSEADGLSGLIVDRFNDVLSVQVTSAIWTDRLPLLLEVLRAQTGCRAVVVRPDPDAIQREGLDSARVRALATPGIEKVLIRENGCDFEANLAEGQKTGFYLDQRDNRRRVAAYAAGRTVLSAYCYTGAFEVLAARAGATDIKAVDSSGFALRQNDCHHQMNHTTVPVELIEADVPACLRRFRDQDRHFDLIILDPPRFVFNQNQKPKGLRAYKDINLLALKLLTPGGILATFSCSGLVSSDDFKTMLAWAGSDAGRRVQILEQLAQPADHPILAGYPESEYLKGLICHVV